MCLGQLAHEWTALNTSVNDRRDSLFSLKQLAEVAWDTFGLVSFVL